MNFLRNIGLRIAPIHRQRQRWNILLAERDDLLAQLTHCKENSAKIQAELAAMQADLGAMRSQIGSPFFQYNSVFDAQECVLNHAVTDLTPRAGYLTNFLGVAIDPKFFPELLDGRAGQVEGAPIPANWHADMAEWAAALRAVDLARGSFTMIELGCGWGCWINNTGSAARRKGLNVHMIGIEGDREHIRFAEEAREANGFEASQVSLHRGIAAATSGVALFPRQDQGGVNWGLKPIFGATPQQRSDAVQSGQYDELPMVALADVAAPHHRIDFLHIDIQGGEADLIDGCLHVLREKVAYLFAGTHSRQIEGRLFDTLLRDGWRLEIERPGLLKLDGATPYMWVDGVQGWRNLALLPLDSTP